MTEWDRRQLCPDGSCVGVIGDNGMCKVCGRQGEAIEGADAAPGDDEDDDDLDDEDGDDQYEGDDEDDEDDDDDSDGDGDGGGDDDASEPAATGDGEWDGRKLCPDGACVGVIGDDGACKVCGKRPS